MFLLMVLVIWSFLLTLLRCCYVSASFRTAGSAVNSIITVFRELILVLGFLLTVTVAVILLFMDWFLNAFLLVLHLSYQFIITWTFLTIFAKHKARIKQISNNKIKPFLKREQQKRQQTCSIIILTMKPSSKTTKYQSGNCILKPTQQLGPLVLGDCNSAMDKKIHKQHNIQTVISIGQQAMPLKQKLPQNCKHYFYDIHDNKSQKVPSELFDEVSGVIEECRRVGGVLVHCYAGVSRSSTFVIAYIMQKWNKSYQTAKEQVKAARSCIYPNDGFVNHLKNYEKVLQKRQQQRLRKLQQEKRLQIQKSLVKSSRKSVRGGVRSADMSPQRVKQMDQQRKKHMHEIILQPIPVIKEQKEQLSQKELIKKNNNNLFLQGSPKNNSLKSSLQNSRMKRKVQQSRPNTKLGLGTKQIREKNYSKKQQVKLPSISPSPYHQHNKQTLTKSTKQNQNLPKHKPLEDNQNNNKKPRQLKVSYSFIKVQKKKQPISHQQQRSILRQSKSVMSTTKYKTTAIEIDESLLNDHEKKVKKIYQHKTVVK